MAGSKDSFRQGEEMRCGENWSFYYYNLQLWNKQTSRGFFCPREDPPVPFLAGASSWVLVEGTGDECAQLGDGTKTEGTSGRQVLRVQAGDHVDAGLPFLSDCGGQQVDSVSLRGTEGSEAWTSGISRLSPSQPAPPGSVSFVTALLMPPGSPTSSCSSSCSVVLHWPLRTPSGPSP